MARSKNNICELPVQLMFNIFVFLPVISLFRCKSVCKSWLSITSNLLSEPEFIKTHYIESQRRQPFSMIKVDEDNKFYIDNDHDTTTVPLKLPQHFTDMTTYISCCNGLVCLANVETDVIYLWNPMIRRFKNLPAPVKETDCYRCVFGFGFDDACNDYKILRIVFKRILDIFVETDLNVHSMSAEMYSANEDSWKEIEVPKTLESFKFRRRQDVGVFLPETRVLYFEGNSELLLFDLHDEVFRLYSFPIPEMNPLSFEKELRISHLMNFEGSLAMVYNESIDGGEIVLSLWTLEVDSGNTSWTKHFNLEYYLMYDHIFLYLGDWQFVGAHNYRYLGDWIFSYHKKGKSRMYLHMPYETMLVSVVKYTESLVSLQGFEQLEYFSHSKGLNN